MRSWWLGSRRCANSHAGYLGCVITDGSFEATYDANGGVTLDRSKPQASLMFFLLRLFEHLRQMGTVPAIDLREYGRSLEQ